MRRHNLALLAVAPLLALGLTACGSGGGGNAAAKVTATTASDQEKARQFAKCMRDNGVDMPDPEVDAGGDMKVKAGGGAGKARSAGGAKFKNAMNKCRHLLPNGGSPQPLSPEDLEKARQFAKCMRQHGIDVPDPDPNGGGIVVRKRGDVNPDEDKFEEAQKACQQYLPELRKKK